MEEGDVRCTVMRSHEVAQHVDVLLTTKHGTEGGRYCSDPKRLRGAEHERNRVVSQVAHHAHCVLDRGISPRHITFHRLSKLACSLHTGITQHLTRVIHTLLSCDVGVPLHLLPVIRVRSLRDLSVNITHPVADVDVCAQRSLRTRDADVRVWEV